MSQGSSSASAAAGTPVSAAEAAARGITTRTAGANGGFRVKIPLVWGMWYNIPRLVSIERAHQDKLAAERQAAEEEAERVLLQQQQEAAEEELREKRRTLLRRVTSDGGDNGTDRDPSDPMQLDGDNIGGGAASFLDQLAAKYKVSREAK